MYLSVYLQWGLLISTFVLKYKILTTGNVLILESTEPRCTVLVLKYIVKVLENLSIFKYIQVLLQILSLL